MPRRTAGPTGTGSDAGDRTMVFFSNLFNRRVPHTAARAIGSAAVLQKPVAAEPDPCLARTKQLVLLADDELESLPPLEYIVPGMIPAGGFVMLVGSSGAGKTFLVVDISLCLATGTPWHGRSVARGPVVYVAGEGLRGLAGRVTAWKEAHGLGGRAGLYTLPQATALTQPEEVDRLLFAIQALPTRPVAVVIDTLSRNMGEGDENSARDVARLTAGVDRIRHATGAAVILVHHTGLKGERERGSSALRANADTTMFLHGSRSGLIRLDCRKQKDGEPFASMALQLTRRGDSCVLLPASPNTVTEAAMPHAELRALRTLAAAMPTGLTYSRWGAACGVEGGAFDRVKKALVSEGLVAGGGGKGVPYVLTPEGARAAQ
jgi:hypothetical protein